jgi:hypothetical protein
MNSPAVLRVMPMPTISYSSAFASLHTAATSAADAASACYTNNSYTFNNYSNR